MDMTNRAINFLTDATHVQRWCKFDFTWWVVPSISIWVLWLSKNIGGHLVFPDRWLLLICTKWNVGAATGRAQNPGKREILVFLLTFLPIFLQIKNIFYAFGFTVISINISQLYCTPWGHGHSSSSWLQLNWQLTCSLTQRIFCP